MDASRRANLAYTRHFVSDGFLQSNSSLCRSLGFGFEVLILEGPTNVA
jgi:hypothetical protein